jgi:hypothetical protein
MTRVGFAIGNGLSRLEFDLERLRGHGEIVGCNWLYRDFTPDYLVGIDKVVRDTLQGKRHDFGFITKDMWDFGRGTQCYLMCDGKEIAPFREINAGYGNNSGIVACWVLSEWLKCDVIYMIGFDFFLDVPGNKYNDVYDTYTQLRMLHNVFMHLNNRIRAKLIRVGPRHPRDSDFWENQLFGIQYMDSFEDMPIAPEARGLSIAEGT